MGHNDKIHDLLLTVKAKRKYHKQQYNSAVDEIISKGTATTRINAAKSRERVRTYNEIISLFHNSFNS